MGQDLGGFVCKIIRGEKLRKKGRPRGSAQDEPLTRFRIYAQIVRLRESGFTLNKAVEQIAELAGHTRTPRVIRNYYEEFKNPLP
jgi:hypothetical protein